MPTAPTHSVWGDRVQIKRMQFMGSNQVHIISKNPEYPPIEATASKLEIGGRALAALTLIEFQKGGQYRAKKNLSRLYTHGKSH
jgi:hypothetical protein